MTNENIMPKTEPKIQMYIHCQTCMSGRLAVGLTNEGLQVWCDDCDKEVIDISFPRSDVNIVGPVNGEPITQA